MVPIPPYFTLFQRLRELGDVVIMDQRGIGESKPNVDCPVTSSLPADFFVDRARMVGAIRNGIAQCAELWRSKGADPTAYTTLESAEDIEDLRKALGVEKINLLAFSYGTRLALAYVDRHGDRVGRVILQGVDGPGMVLKRPAAVTLKLRRVGQFLGQDPAWHGSTDLLAAASVTRKRLAEKPATVVITDKATGQSRTLLIGRDGFDAIASLNLNNLRLPAMLVSAAVGEDRLLTRFAEATWNTFSSGTVGLAARAIDCAADRPDVRREAIAAESVTAPFGTPIDDAVLSDDFCRAVGYNVPLTEFAKPVSSSVPTLLLTGTLDATTPIENAIEVSQGLRNAVLLDVENAQHEALPVPDVQDIVVDFLHGVDVTKRRAATSIPHFLPIEDALQHGSER
jgi:pimeloyl-ACP methyl ester carboxylesterase